MQSALPASTYLGRYTALAAALAFFVCFACALTGVGLPAPVATSGKTAFANHKAGVATIPRQGYSARVSSLAQRESAKSPISGSGLGLTGPASAAVFGDGSPIVAPSPLPVHGVVRTAHLPRGPPAIAS